MTALAVTAELFGTARSVAILRQSKVAGVQLVDLPPGILDVVCIGDHVVGDCQPLVPGGLSREHAARLSLGLGITLDKTADLGIFVAIDDQNTVNVVSKGRSDQKWYDDDLVIAAGFRGLGARCVADPRMRDRLEALAGVFVREHDAPHFRSIQASVLRDDVIAELTGRLEGDGWTILKSDPLDSFGHGQHLRQWADLPHPEDPAKRTDVWLSWFGKDEERLLVMLMYQRPAGTEQRPDDLRVIIRRLPDDEHP